MERVSPLILVTKTGVSFKRRYFARLWEKATIDAGLRSVTMLGSDEPVELHYHDLRGTAVTLLSEAGCTPQQIATITGHSLKTVHWILERYLARTRGLAEQAIFEIDPIKRRLVHHVRGHLAVMRYPLVDFYALLAHEAIRVRWLTNRG